MPIQPFLSCNFFYLLFFASTHLLYAQKPVMLSSEKPCYTLDSRVAVLADAAHHIDFEKVLLPENQQKFVLATKPFLNHSYTEPDYWFRAHLQYAPTKSPTAWVLQMQNPNIDSIEVYFLNEKQQIIQHYLTGDKFAFSQRPIDNTLFTFDIPFQEAENITVYMKCSGLYAKHHRIYVQEKNFAITGMQAKAVRLGLFSGILIALILYNLFVYLNIRDFTYLYYVGYQCCALSYSTAVTGLSFQYVYPDCPFITGKVANLSVTSAVILSVWFSYYYLKIQDLLPQYHQKICIAFTCVNLVFALIFVSVTQAHIFFPTLYLFNTVVILAVFYQLMLGITALIKQQRNARFYVAAWFLLLGGSLLYSLNINGLLPMSFVLDFDILFSAATLEAVLFSWGLADQLQMKEKAKLAAQKQTLETLRENEKMLLKNQLQQMEQARLQEKTAYQARQLAGQGILLAQKNEWLISIEEKLKPSLGILATEQKYAIKKIFSEIQEGLHLEDDWEQYKIHFEEVHPYFFKTLQQHNPRLTQKDLRMCAYIKINISNKEIAQMLHITEGSLRVNLNRLKLKLGLDKDQDLRTFLLNF